MEFSHRAHISLLSLCWTVSFSLQVILEMQGKYFSKKKFPIEVQEAANR